MCVHMCHVHKHIYIYKYIFIYKCVCTQKGEGRFISGPSTASLFFSGNFSATAIFTWPSSKLEAPVAKWSFGWQRMVNSLLKHSGPLGFQEPRSGNMGGGPSWTCCLGGRSKMTFQRPRELDVKRLWTSTHPANSSSDCSMHSMPTPNSERTCWGSWALALSRAVPRNFPRELVHFMGQSHFGGTGASGFWAPAVLLQNAPPQPMAICHHPCPATLHASTARRKKMPNPSQPGALSRLGAAWRGQAQKAQHSSSLRRLI